jgi:hypothetical protein
VQSGKYPLPVPLPMNAKKKIYTEQSAQKGNQKI